MKIKNTIIGDGVARIVVSFTGHNLSSIEEELEFARKNESAFDILEIRGDSFDSLSRENHLNIVETICQEWAEYPIIYTYRTLQEGGKGMKSVSEYHALLTDVLNTCAIDIIDIEFFKYEDIVKALITLAQSKGVTVLLSVHDMHDTPHFEEIMATYQSMSDAGGEILKLAYMPSNGRDVLSVLSAIHDAKKRFNAPIVGISLGDMGRITRIAGGVFGSCMMYGYLVDKTAPGQVEASLLKMNLHELNG